MSLPLFYFKPTICWIDDDQIFLDAVNISFAETYHCLSFNDPDAAIKFFNSYQSPLANMKFKREFTESDKFGINNHYPVDINISKIKNLLALPEKRQEIAVLVVDYNMPNKNGLEIFYKLKSLPCKKILLTGEATYQEAIEAFNLGLIDKFIKKEHNITYKLKNCIDELIYQYFYTRTAFLVSHLEASKPSLFSDQHFVDFFKNWCQVNNITEFYLLNKQGSFLVKNKNGDIFYFITMSEQDRIEFLQLNDELAERVGQLLQDVSAGKIIPFFGSEKESWEIDTVKWKDYFYPCQIISGRENYYWTVVNK